MDWLNELYERLARDGMECGAVCDLLRGEHVMQREDIEARMRRLVTEYTANGQEALRRFSGADLHLLLSAKLEHLGDVSERCNNGKDLFIAARLKRILEGDVREIGQAVQEKGLER